MDYSLGYREVIPDQTLPDKWKEITLNTGGNQSTLQDIKVPEKAGGYCYQDSSKYYTRNRFIYWRIIHDVLELVEHSLDVNISNCRVKYKFTDTPILDGISIHETTNFVVLLIVTVSSVHKLIYSHPDKIHRKEQETASVTDNTVQSIFYEASVQHATEPRTFHIIPAVGSISSPVPHAAASCLIKSEEEAIFALAYQSGIIILLCLDSKSGLVHSSELKQESIVPRFLTGIATAFRGRAEETEVVMSMVIHSLDNDIYLFALYREGHIRMWSCTKAQCVTSIDIAASNRIRNQIIQNHTLKKMCKFHNELYLCTYLKIDEVSEFFFFKVIQDSGFYKIIRLCSLLAPNQHIVDFSFTMTKLWATWRTTEIDSVAVTHIRLPLLSDQIKCEWESSILIQSVYKDNIINDIRTDPRQAYISYIFHPGRFLLMDIIRALNIYQRSTVPVELTLSISLVKERVCMAVESEIQAEVMDYELMDEDYLEIVNRCWSKFYSCVLQYHLNGLRPVGLLLLPNVHGVILLKKSCISFLRPMEVLEHLMLCNETSHTTRFKTTPILSQDENTCNDLITLISTLNIFEEQLSDDIKSLFEKELHQLKAPDIIVENILNKLMFTAEEVFLDFDFQLDLQRKLENIRDICSSMAMLLEVLTYNFNDQPSASELDYRYNAVSNTNLHKQRFFQSCLGISTLSGIITQVLGLRFSICRNLLILQQIVLSRCELFDSQSLHSIKSSLAPRTVVLTQAYYIVLWICTTNACITSSQALSDTCVQRLLTLKINVREPNIGHQLRPFSLVESFIQYCSRQHVYNIVSNPSINNENIIVWHSGILSLVTDIAQLIWPISGKFTFPQWLLSTCQFSLVQEYVRLLSSWCEWNGASRKFIAGISFLEMGEPYKACDYFLRASGGVLTDAYLSNIVFLPSAVNESKSLVQYYLKVIEIFEQHNAYDCILDIAMTAMSVTQKDDTNLLTLHSIIFAQHLNLQHHIQAYNCLETNPDIGRRVDCLRQLVITLFSRKKLTELVTFPYINMYYNMVKIMEARARSVDLMENNYYDFLYSFHMNKGNIRKAASIMYEQAIRLGQEPHSLLNISKQTRCLLACINALYLVKDDYRWIVKPTFGFNWIKEDFKLSKKRNINGNEIVQYKIKQQIEVLELKDIEREYVLSDGKLRLAKINPETRMTNQTCASEIVSIMSNLGLYYNALQVCQHYKLCSKAIFESLVSHCISFSINDGGKAWNWIYQNDIFDISVSYSNMADVAWNLLENLLIRFENIGESLLHKAIVMKLYHHGTFIPKWLHSSYTRLNAAEFLRLMIDNGRLEEASQFSLEYIQATIGKGNSQFLNKQSILSSTPHAHLPFNIIEMLLLELQSASENETIYLKMYESLSNAIKNYQKVVERTSKNIIQINLGGLKSNI